MARNPIYSLDELSYHAADLRGCALTVGNFDGVHRGHQTILKRLAEAARRNKAKCVALSFEPHPVRFFLPSTHPFRLSTPSQKFRLLRHYGVDHPVFVSFGMPLSGLEPEAFVCELLFRRFTPSLVLVGYDFNFGKGRRGTPEMIRSLGEASGIPVEIQAPVKLDGLPVSSSAVRRALGAGDVQLARRLLGHPFALVGPVVTGAGRGKTIGFPTANLQAENELLPAHGVYAAYLETTSGLLSAITNIGVRPTFNGDGVTVESFILDPAVDPGLNLYGEHVALHFGARIREERRFSGPDALVAQIQRDIDLCRRLQHDDDPTDIVRL